MLPDQHDAAYLWDMLEAAREVQQFVAGRRMQEYLGDNLLQAAVERKIEIIGEAASRVSESFRQACTEIPWRLIIAQRHVLAHQYGKIQHDRIWRVATMHISDLITQLTSLIPSPPPDLEGDCASK